MNQRYRLLGLLLLLPLATLAQADWVLSTVDRVSVRTPVPLLKLDLAKLAKAAGQPKEQVAKLRGNQLQVFSANDAAGTYTVLCVDNSAAHTAFTAGHARDLFYEGLIDAALGNESGVLLERTSFPTAGGEGVEFRYRGRQQGTGKRVVKYSRAVLVDKTCYSLGFIPRDSEDSTGAAGTAARRRFFNSITVKP